MGSEMKIEIERYNERINRWELCGAIIAEVQEYDEYVCENGDAFSYLNDNDKALLYTGFSSGKLKLLNKYVITTKARLAWVLLEDTNYRIITREDRILHILDVSTLTEEEKKKEIIGIIAYKKDYR